MALAWSLIQDVSYISQRTLQSVFVTTRRDLSNGLTEAPRSMDQKSEASHGVIITITTTVLLSAVIF